MCIISVADKALDMEVPCKGHVALGHDGHRPYILQQLTGEVCVLEPGSWALHFDGEGQGQVRLAQASGGVQAQWLGDLFDIQLYDADGAWCVHVKGKEDLEFYKAFMTKYSCVLLRCQPADESSAYLLGWVLERRHGGSQVFASLTHFHRHLGLPGTPHRWYLHDWGAWRKHLETCSLGPEHLKKALPTKQAGLAQPSGTALPERFWPHPAISMIGLVCLCSRWASRSRNRVAKQQAAVLAFTAFLHKLLLTLGKAWSIIIYTRGASLGFVAACMYTVCLCRSSHVGGHVHFVLGGFRWLHHGFKQCCFGRVHHGFSFASHVVVAHAQLVCRSFIA